MRLKNGLRKKTIKAIKTILLIMNDKEKIKEVLGILEIKIKDYEDEHKEFFVKIMYDRIRVSNDNLLFVFFMSLDEL